MRGQPALYHGPGAFSGLGVWRGRSPVSATSLREAAVRVLEATREDEAQVLVALSPALLDLELPALLPRERGELRFPSTQAELFFQVAALDRDGLLVAMRKIDALVRDVVWRDEEVLGGK